MNKLFNTRLCFILRTNKENLKIVLIIAVIILSLTITIHLIHKIQSSFQQQINNMQSTINTLSTTMREVSETNACMVEFIGELDRKTIQNRELFEVSQKNDIKVFAEFRRLKKKARIASNPPSKK